MKLLKIFNKINFVAITLLCTCLKPCNLIAQKSSVPLFRLTNFNEKQTDPSTADSLKKYFKAYSTATFPAAALSNFLQSNDKDIPAFELQMGNKNLLLQLNRSNLVAANFKLTVQTPKGLQTQPTIVENIFYKGYADGNVENIVRLTVKDGFVTGVIKINNEEIFIQSLSDYIKTASPNEVIIFKAADAIANNLPCGYTATKNIIATATQQNQVNITNRPQAGECKKIPFVFLTDYSMYTYFNMDVNLMQNKMLSVLNIAQGVYTGLNFGIDTTVDVGNDELNFELKQFHVSTCNTCDFVPESQQIINPFVTSVIRNWIRQNIDTTTLTAVYYWTKREIAQQGVPVAGISYDVFNACTPVKLALIVCNYREDVSYLRQVAAHELGHTFGCFHDNAINPLAVNYIMYASVNPSVYSFSTLVDFVGYTVAGQPYSSKLMIAKTVRKINGCLGNCGTNICQSISNPEISNISNTDKLLLKWVGVSNSFIVRVKQKNAAANSGFIFNQVVNGNSIVLQGLQKCTSYTAEVINNCNKSISISFLTSAIKLTKLNVINERASLYDIKLNTESVNVFTDSLRITIDHENKYLGTFQNVVIIKNLFSDGARHRIDLYYGKGIGCKATYFYTAPYYRKNATLILSENFNSCAKPTNWKDSILSQGGIPPILLTPYWTYKNLFTQVAIIPQGTIDSSCMLLFNNELTVITNCAGGISLTSPAIDMRNYKNIYLSFDYKQKLRLRLPSNRQAIFQIQGFDGVQWLTLFNAPPTRILTPNNGQDFWDTLPPRKFISLDRFNNPDFKIRVIADDSSAYLGGSPELFVALDNIKIDGYLKPSITKNLGVKLFPNPVNNELFIYYDEQSDKPNSYRIIDSQGKIIKAATLTNDRIYVGDLSLAIYFIQFNYVNGTKTQSYKFLKL